MKSLFEYFLLELAQALELKTLAPDAKEACLLIMKEGEVPLLFECDEHLVPNTILASSVVLSFPHERRKEVCMLTLKLNENAQSTASVKPDEDLFFLHLRIHPDVQSADLKGVITEFLRERKGALEQLHQLLQTPAQNEVIPPPPSSFFPYKA